MSNNKEDSIERVKSRKFALNLLIISFLSILIVKLFVEFILSKHDFALFMISFSMMIFTVFMILASIISILIFLIRLALKKKEDSIRNLGIIITITIILTLSTTILLKEENKYYHAINMNWNINLPREYEEIFYKDSGESFLGDGERYSVFKYDTLDEINSAIDWKSKDEWIESYVIEVLENLEVAKEYYPDFNSDFKYYYNIKEDSSKIYILLNSGLKKVYIVEEIF